MNTPLSEKIFVPDGAPVDAATARVTHMAIGAHQDDLEIFAYHGIEACYASDSLWFAGVTVTDGGGSARVGPYESFTDEQMKQVRHEEQNRAAELGQYSLQAQLGYASSTVKDAARSAGIVEELVELLDRCRPQTLYLHNPADKHDTHIAVLSRCIAALRRMPPEARPARIYGCEVWRDLDWLDDASKVMLPVDGRPELAKQLIDVFASQVAGGKDYTRATLGRRHANATYFASHQVDAASAYTVAVDLSSLLQSDTMSLTDFITPYLEHFKSDVIARIQKFDE